MAGLNALYDRSTLGSDSNFGVDLVINFHVPPKERDQAEASFIELIRALTKVGLTTEVRHGNPDYLLVFVKVVSDKLLAQQAYRARLQDWLYGVRTTSPEKDVSKSLQDEPIAEAERLRLIYLMISKSVEEGGAGITPGNGKWRHVRSVFPLHDHRFNKAWIQKWSGKYLLDQRDVDEIRDKYGESVAFYFAFMRVYVRALIIPSAIGFASWLLLGQFSMIYALASCLWSVVFFEYWKMQEVDLAVQWGTRGVSSIQHQRPEFRWDFEAEDPVTGEPVKVYPPLKRLQTQLLQIPFALVCILVLGSLIVTCNSLEIFINQVYDGPGKQYLTFLPTILLVILTPTSSSILMKAAESLTQKENYENTDAYNAALISKQFVLNFITSYMPLLFTAFIYIPFGHILTPFLDFWRSSAQTITLSEKPLPTRDFEVDPSRISNQMFYFTVTAQIVNLMTEVVVPYIKKEVLVKVKEFQSKGAAYEQDHAEEAEFLSRVRNECELEVYDVTSDYREMVMQFGYLSLFSVTWPLTACFFLVNNWVEMRSDALKITLTNRRPVPWRSDSIGPWLNTMGFLSWLGSVVSSAIVFLCSGSKDGVRGTTANITASTLLLSVFLSENFYLLVQHVVRYVLSKVERPGLQKERKERYSMKKRLVEEHIGQSIRDEAIVPGIATGDKINRKSLEEEARQISIKGHGSPEETFWQRQRGMEETIEIGRRMMSQPAAKTKTTPPAAAPSLRAKA